MNGFDEKTEILTESGWKSYIEISSEDNFATLNISSNKIEFQKSNNIYIHDYSGEMFYVKSQGVDMIVTSNHRLYFKHFSKSYKIGKADSINLEAKSRITFRASGTMNNKEYDKITDDELRICAWIHTDGHINKKSKLPSYSIYQRKSKVHLITEILEKLEYKYSIKYRDRDIKSICGKTLKKKPDISCHITILRGKMAKSQKGEFHRLDSLISQKYVLPKWVYELSDRQFTIFLSSLIDGDGSRHPYHPETSWMLYGMKNFLDQVHMACVIHGYRSSISEYRKNTWRLNINKTDVICVDPKNRNKIEEYNGKVFCVTVPNSTVIVRRNGKVHISGSCLNENVN